MVRVWALAGTTRRAPGKDTLFVVPLSLHPGAFLGTGEFMLGSDPAIGGGGIEMLPVASYYWNQDKLLPDGTLGSYADLIFIITELPAICWILD